MSSSRFCSEPALGPDQSPWPRNIHCTQPAACVGPYLQGDSQDTMGFSQSPHLLSFKKEYRRGNNAACMHGNNIVEVLYLQGTACKCLKQLRSCDACSQKRQDVSSGKPQLWRLLQQRRFNQGS